MSIEVTVEYAHREWNSYDHVVHIRNYQQLQAKVAELEAEVERLSVAHVKACQANADSQAELAAEQEEIEHLKQVQECHAIDLRERDASIKSHAEKNRELKAQLATAEQRYLAWEGGEEWEQLAFQLCADECGEESCNELIWEGCPPEPWGDRWLKYESEAKRIIQLVRQYAPDKRAEQRVAEACALQVATETRFHWLDAARVAKEIRSGEWKRYLK